jgi:hypothetical protein
MTTQTNRKAVAMPRYELCEVYRALQVTDGHGWWEAPVGDGFSTLDEAVKYAVVALAARTDDSRFSWVGVIETAVEDGEPTGWAAGWVTADGSFTEGDYENDPRLWDHEEGVQA